MAQQRSRLWDHLQAVPPQFEESASASATLLGTQQPHLSLRPDPTTQQSSRPAEHRAEPPWGCISVDLSEPGQFCISSCSTLSLR